MSNGFKISSEGQTIYICFPRPSKSCLLFSVQFSWPGLAGPGWTTRSEIASGLRAKLTVRKLDEKGGDSRRTIVFFSSVDLLSVLGEVLSYWLEMSDTCSSLLRTPINISKFVLKKESKLVFQFEILMSHCLTECLLSLETLLAPYWEECDTFHWDTAPGSSSVSDQRKHKTRRK